MNKNLISINDIVMIKKTNQEGTVVNVSFNNVIVNINGNKKEFKKSEVELKDLRMI